MCSTSLEENDIAFSKQEDMGKVIQFLDIRSVLWYYKLENTDKPLIAHPIIRDKVKTWKWSPHHNKRNDR